MNAPLRHPVIPSPAKGEGDRYPRFPRLTPAEKALQDAADRVYWANVRASMNLKPGIIGNGSTPSHPAGLEWGTERENSRYVLR